MAVCHTTIRATGKSISHFPAIGLCLRYGRRISSAGMAHIALVSFVCCRVEKTIHLPMHSFQPVCVDGGGKWDYCAFWVSITLRTALPCTTHVLTSYRRAHIIRLKTSTMPCCVTATKLVCTYEDKTTASHTFLLTWRTAHCSCVYKLTD